MDSSLAASAYKNASINFAPPVKVIQMMYDGALRFIREAQQLDPKAQKSAFQEKVNQADAIVCELRLSLDHTVTPEICGQLSSLYIFVEEEFRKALVEGSIAPLEGTIDVLSTLLEGWREIDVDEPRKSA